MTQQHTGLGELIDSLSGTIADWTLENLLDAMRLAFEASNDVLLARLVGLEGYHESIEGFNAVYGFQTKDKVNGVHATAVFENGKMLVKTTAPDQWDLMVSFKDTGAFWDFIFSGGKDILESLLANDVEVYGNVNYLYKFGFLARDLKDRLGLA